MKAARDCMGNLWADAVARAEAAEARVKELEGALAKARCAGYVAGLRDAADVTVVFCTIEARPLPMPWRGAILARAEQIEKGES